MTDSKITLQTLKNGVRKHIQPLNAHVNKIKQGKGPKLKDEDLTTSQQLMLIVEEISFFKDTAGTAWAKIEEKCYQVRSKLFKRLLQRKYYELYDKTPYSQALQDVIDQATAKALFDADTEDVFVRVATEKDKIVVDRFEGKVKIQEGTWINTTSTKANFWEPKGLKVLPEPKVSPEGLTKLRKYLNFETEADFQLLIAWLLAAYNPEVACPILVLQGEQGSAKTTNARVLRSLIDPSKAMINPAPRNERDLVIQAQNSRILCLDNLSGLKKSLSDALCRICTGTGFTTRKNFSDADQQIFEVKRPIILNGIDDIATRGDLLDRSIVLGLPAIPPHKRRDERAFWKSFKQDQPHILGGLYDVIAGGLAENKPNLPELPRMADFAEWVTRCEVALDWEVGSILRAYNENKDNAIEVGLDGDYLATAIMKILDNQSHYEGTATELVKKLHNIAPDVDEKYLPTTKTLKSRLTRLAPALRKMGITWEYKRKGKDGSRTYVLDKEEDNVSEVSVMSENSSKTDATDSSDTSEYETSEFPF